jgi:hypothetical protein
MMANKKATKSSKPMAKKDMKKTKGGILIALNQPSLRFDGSAPLKYDPLKVEPGSLNFYKP